MIDTPIAWLRSQLHASVYEHAWHGPSLFEALDGVSFAQAVARPIPGAHTIAELVHHAAGWMEEVCRRLGGVAPDMPARGDWPALPPSSDYEWSAWQGDLTTAAEALDRALAAFPADRLERKVGDGAHDPPLGTGVTYAVMINGVIQHNVYHAGQILLLARAAR
jgi:uncharacterized damage-inducible protein DinB